VDKEINVCLSLYPTVVLIIQAPSCIVNSEMKVSAAKTALSLYFHCSCPSFLHIVAKFGHYFTTLPWQTH
jgi:hypothetical protein